MPALRLSRRRKSSHVLFSPAKAGIYGIPQRPVTFAPNVTPVTFVDPEDPAADLDADAGGSPTTALFPPSLVPAPPPTRKRCPPGKRRSQGYIPRPPNAFMLFRADFVRQKHVPGTIETNHGSLSKIIGNCWRQLPLEEKRIWEIRAKQEKANHKAQFPDYRFRPVHNKNKNAQAGGNGAQGNDADAKRKEKAPATLEDERRCEEVAQLLLEGKKGEELARAVRNLDRERERELNELERSRRGSAEGSVSPAVLHLPGPLHMPTPVNAGLGMQFHMPAPQFLRRPSSVPLPNEFYGGYGGIAMPALPFFTQQGQSQSRAASPVASISRHANTFAPYGYNFAPNPFQTDFSFGAHDHFEQQQRQQQHQQHQQDVGVDQTFAFSNPFAADQTLAPPSFSPGFSFSSGFSGFASGVGHPSLAQRNSLGMGLGRRASSAQATLMRAYTMPVYTHTSQQPLERDHSPLPPVEAELFAADFSFGGGSGSASAVSAPMEDPLSPAEVDPASVSGSGSSTSYDGSPAPAAPVGLGMAHPQVQVHMHEHEQQTLDGMYGAPPVGVAVAGDDMYAAMWDGMQLGVDMSMSIGMGVGGEMGKGMEMEMGMGMEYFQQSAF